MQSFTGLIGSFGGEYERLALQLEQLIRTGYALSSEGDGALLLERLADGLADLIPYDSCLIMRLDENRLHPVLVRDPYEAALRNYAPAVGEGVWGAVTATGIPELIDEVYKDPRYSRIPGVPIEPESMLVVPLIQAGSVIGVISLHRFHRRTFTPHHLNLLKLTSFFATSVLVQNRLRVEQTHRNEQQLRNERLLSSITIGGEPDRVLLETLDAGSFLTGATSAAILTKSWMAGVEGELFAGRNLSQARAAALLTRIGQGEQETGEVYTPVTWTEGDGLIRMQPLTWAGDLLGYWIMVLPADTSPAFPEAGLRTLAAGAEIAIHTWTLQREQRRAAQQLDWLAHWAADLSNMHQDEDLAARITASACQLVGAERAFLAVLNDDTRQVQVRATVGLDHALWQGRSLSTSLIQSIAVEQGSVLFRDLAADLRLDHEARATLEAVGIYAGAAVVFSAGPRALGLLMVAESKGAGRVLRPRDLAVLEAFCQISGLVLENQQLSTGAIPTQGRPADASGTSATEMAPPPEPSLPELRQKMRLQYAQLERSLLIHNRLTQTLLAGRGVDGISATLASLVGSPVVLEDRYFNMIVASIPEASTISTGIFPDWATPQEFLNKPGVQELLQTVERSRRAMLVPAFPDIGIRAPSLIAPIVVRSEMLGYVSIYRGSQEFTDLDFMACEQAAIVVALEMMRERTAAEVEYRLRGDFFDDLLQGRFEDDGSIIKRAAYLRYNLGNASLLLLIRPANLDRSAEPPSDTSRHVTERRLVEMLSDAVGQFCRESIVVAKGGLIIMLVPTVAAERGGLGRKSPGELAEVMQKRMRMAFPHMVFSISIGPPCFAPKDYGRAYQAAKRCLDLIHKRGQGGGIIAFEDTGVNRLLFSLDDPSALTDFVQRTLGTLLLYDREHGTELVHTLRMYLDQNLSLQRTAGACIVHISTLRYRLQRIQEILGVDVQSAEVRLNLHLALKAHETFAAAPQPQ